VENNISVVGKDEVNRGRDMNWLRIDRYYADGPQADGADVSVAYQPMMCQHCDNAPCESVCPVAATQHSEEGLNDQAYNRCIGTRYCGNNCPYKVRRFNWFNYDLVDEEYAQALNPDVTVRKRGVMEKCSMCVQRIEDARALSKSEGRAMRDGDIQTACQQACPTEAIIFGDQADKNSRLVKLQQSAMAYEVLEDLNVKSSVRYHSLVRNPISEPGNKHNEKKAHG
jgi:molybdopterin-containing oxidoreductase family iron-sulfur binding subunit